VIETQDHLDLVSAAAAEAAQVSPLSGVALHWAPVVSREGRPTGFRLRLRGQARGASMDALLKAVLAGFGEESGGVPHGLVILAPQDVGPDDSLAQWGAPRNVLLEVDERVLAVPEDLARVMHAQSHGARLALNVRGSQWPAAHRLAPFQYLLGDVAMLASAGRAPRDVAVLGTGARSRGEVLQVLGGGAAGVIGWPPPPPQAGSAELQPQQRALLDLLRMVRIDADLAEIERAFKGEPMLAYLLLTLANSPAFRRGTPLASLRHAIQLLGYQRLAKWLVLLMVICAKEGQALPAIYQAVLRGLLLENCARAAGAGGTVPDHCFVVGVFSLLDRITGRSLPLLTQDLELPDDVAAALQHGGGPYANWLALAEAVEDDGSASPQRWLSAAQAVGLSAASVNLALLQALATNDALQTMI
jgi:EAL and modified HD-GYP domain-containing signal transduction protein